MGLIDKSAETDKINFQNVLNSDLKKKIVRRLLIVGCHQGLWPLVSRERFDFYVRVE